MSRFAALVLLLAAGCDGPALRCSSGCTSARSDAGPPDDAGAAAIVESADAAPPAPDGGSGGWTLEPPGTPPIAPGCDGASDECDAWAATLVGALPGCALAIDPGAQAIAERHAQHQADLDRLTSASPDGSLFDQLRAGSVRFRDAGAAFSVTRQGPADVLARWSENEATAAILERCWTHAGAAFRTSDTGASYVTLVVIAR